jgi:uncharacterized membrane protein YbhN (UPF0104 family)
MWESAVEVAAALERALHGIGSAVAGASLGWLALGLALHLLNQVARGRGWYAVVRSACPDEPGLRRRDVVAAWVAGAGAGGMFSARGGDAVRVLLLRRHAPRAGCPLIAGTIVAEGAGELTVGLALLGVALAAGVGPELGAPTSTVLGVALGMGVVALVGSRVAWLRRLASRVATGCRCLRSPGRYARVILPWQLVSRVCRFGALACFLAAFSLPVTPLAVLLVMFAQGSGRLVPFAPAAVGATVAMLAASFGPVTGAEVSAAQLAAFFVGMSTVLTIVGATLSLTICLRAASWRSLAATLRITRRAPAGAA